MTTALPDPLRQSLRDYLHSKIGLLFTEKQDSELFRKIGLAAPAFGHHDPVRFAEWLIVDTVTDKQLGDLASYLTIGETYFFREKKSFDFLEQIYLPELIRKRYESERRLSVWCAGCATGEEAYSLAIALTQSIPDIHRWNISILATDINPLFLEKARLGIYKKWSFRTNTPEFIRKYFTTAGENEFHIRPEIKKLVKFSSLNLAEDCYPSSVNKTQSSDIIFCRNVLIYFSPEGNKFVTERLYNSLINGGILVVSPVEMTGMIYPKFNKITYSGFTIYQKGAHHREEKSKVLSGLHVPVPKPPVTLKELKKEQPIKVEEPQKYLRHPEETREKERLKQEPIKESPGENDYSNAESLFFKGAFEEAELLLTRLVADSQDSCNPALLLLAKAKANLGKLKEAEELCEKGISMDKLDVRFYYLLATVMQEQGNDERAIVSLRQALYIDPDFVLAHFLHGTLCLKLGNREEGQQSFKNAVSSLSKLHSEDILPESDGLTVERFRQIINSITK